MRLESKLTGQLHTAHIIHRIFTLPNGSAYLEFSALTTDDALAPVKAIDIPKDQWAHLNAQFDPQVGDYLFVLEGGNYSVASPDEVAKNYTILNEGE